MVTVCIPVYNGHTFLERCLQAIVKQTYTNLDILVVVLEPYRAAQRVAAAAVVGGAPRPGQSRWLWVNWNMRCER